MVTDAAPVSFPLHLLAPPDPATLPLPHPAHPADGVRLLRGAVYAAPDGSRPLTVDLWLPEEAAPPRACRRLRSRRCLAHRPARRPRPSLPLLAAGPLRPPARAGFAVACPDYRLSGEVSYPAQTDDLTATLAWLHTRADDLGPDTPRTVLWGESAGGRLAALTALTHPVRTITATVTWYAATELPKLAEDRPKGAYDPKDPDSFEALLLGGAPAERAEAARDASPVTHVGPKAPPFLLLHGVADTLIPARQSVRFAQALRAAGHHPDLHLLAGGDHLWVGLCEQDVEDCYVRTVDFARRCTRDAEKAP
ncbi:alpha/beta hydrolase fold domain-containing protein [Streptomyces olivaceoviridis]|uniref:alpha/beta hydrolase fold domain-containing protein n=1 Tax=Streptomyces olivaceoviridis TaxID=1921 RepID=UPI0036BF7643